MKMIDQVKVSLFTLIVSCRRSSNISHRQRSCRPPPPATFTPPLAKTDFEDDTNNGYKTYPCCLL